MTLAIFDLDNTILRGDSDSAWLSFLIQHDQVDKERTERMNQKFYDDYVRGRLDFDEYSEFAYGILNSIHISKLKILRKEYFKEKVMPMICPNARDLFEMHRERNHTLIISTSTNEFVCRPVVGYLKTDYLIATKLEISDDGYTGRHYGTPNFGEGKVTNMHLWLAENPGHQLATAYFYSDSINDLPLLEAVGYPRPVNVDEQLREVSKKKGWRIITFNK